MKIAYLITIIAFNSLSFSAELLPEEFEKLAEIVTIETKPIDPESDIERECDPSQNNHSGHAVESPTLKVKGSGEWRVKVQYSMTGPKSKPLMKEYLTNHGDEVYSKLDTIINGEYESYEDRRASIAKMCEGTSFEEKLRLGSALGTKLSRIYDYSRANGGSDEAISPEQQWQGLKSKKAVGVCRDASITISQFLISCGVPENKIRIDEYQTLDAGHQVTSIYDENGDLYTINWSELYKHQDDGVFMPGARPKIVNSGLVHREFHPESGKVLNEALTELGEILKVSAGGKSSKPHYVPDILKLDLGYNNFNVNLFKGTTEIGDEVTGAGFYYQAGSEQTEYFLNAGFSVAKSSRDEQFNQDVTSTLEQDLVVVNITTQYSPNYNILSVGDTELKFRPKIGYELDFYSTSNTFNNESGSSSDAIMQGTIGGKIEAKKGPVDIWASYDKKYNYVRNANNSEQSGESKGGIEPMRTLAEAGVRFHGDEYFIETYGQSSVANLERSNAVGVKVASKSINTDGEITYITYDRDNVPKKKYIVTKVGTTWSSIRVEAVLQKDLEYKDTQFGINISGKL